MSAENLGEAWRRIEPVLEAYSDSHGSFRVGSLSLSAFREMIPELLSNISHSLRRIETMTAELERYILTGPSDKLERVDVNAAVKASLALLAGMLKRSTCALQVHYGQPMPEIRGNFQALEQVVINLVANACHALPAPRCPMIVSTEYRQESEEVIIAISDEGIGVTEEGLHRIVNPASLTARGVENGAGRGLAVVSAIVGAWGGRLEFESEAGKGTNVRVVLPAADRETPGVATETRVCGESGRS
jgi:C4-dicarboxylate-specific signal transduction histidine kinase